ncbi:MAG: hypothetical protein ACK5IQ_08320, partial [Bacteroidales bacterium]
MKRILPILWIIIIPILSNAQNNLIPDTSDCGGTRPAFAFDIQPAWNSSTNENVDSRYTPIVGDIDGDGSVEVLTANGMPGGGGILYVFNGKTGALKGQINTSGIGTTYSSGICILRRNSSDKGSVVIAGRDGNVYLYEVSSGSETSITFNSTPVWTTSLTVNVDIPVVADLNGDGIVEIVVGKYILNANTGAVLSTLSFEGGTGYQNCGQRFNNVADVDGDGLADVLAGSFVYRFNNGFVSSPAPWKKCGRYGESGIDGTNIVADIDQDGYIDVVFVYWDKNKECEITVWTPSTDNEIDHFTMIVGNSVSYPFVGDIDGRVHIVGGVEKKYPEICVNTAGHLRAFTFDGTNFLLKWDLTHTDMSGSTILTLFDFNLDGIVELVYRDESKLRILNGQGSSPIDAATPIVCGSATIVETPVVADVTGDGSANIIVTGNFDGTTAVKGELRVFEGAASKWASCPSIWNQQLYSNLLVNLDLTIPKRIEPVNTTFTQTCAEGKKIQFYNGGPMQAPFISEETYCPIDLSPDLYVENGSFEYLSATSVKITVTVKNVGLVLAAASTPYQYYKNAKTTANVIGSGTLGVDLSPGQSTTITRTFTGLNPMPSQFYFRVVDDGINFPASGAYSDCNLTNNTKSFGTLELTKVTNASSACIDGSS